MKFFAQNLVLKRILRGVKKVHALFLLFTKKTLPTRLLTLTKVSYRTSHTSLTLQ